MTTINTDYVIAALQTLREHKPLVLNITNYVVMNNTANALLAVGASPIMAHSQQEIAEMMAISSALVINIGTLDSAWITRMQAAISQANNQNKPVILDPVGCGASQLRTATARKFAAQANQLIIRANASEIMALAGEQAQTKGVDALDSSDVALQSARYVAAHYQCSVVISGARDYVITAQSEYQLDNGHAMMPYVTGMGCTHTALTAAFAASGDHTGVAATAILGIAGELAAQQANGPGSLQLHLLDALYQLNSATIRSHLKLSELGAQHNPYQLYLVSDDNQDIATLCDVVRAAIAGGVTMVQLREKHSDIQAFISRAKAVKLALAGSGVPLIINDRVDVALAVQADGVHLGQSDMPAELARQLIGPDMLLGLSVENEQQLQIAQNLPVDYLGISAIFATPTKTDTVNQWGITGLMAAVASSSLPLVAIGGINDSNIQQVAATGVDGIALVSAICHAPCPRLASQKLLQLITASRN